MKINTIEVIEKMLVGFNGVVRFVGVVFMLVFLYAMFLERPYLSYPSHPMRVIGTTFHAGDMVPVEVQRCNNSFEQKTFMSSRALVNVLTQLPVEAAVSLIEAKPGCTEKFINAASRIPLGTPPGIYHYTGRSDINGLLRTFDVTWVTQEFEVKPDLKVTP